MILEQTRLKIVNFLQEHLDDIQLVYLFGSFATGNAVKSSDVDLAVFCGRPLDSVVRWNVAQELAIAIENDVDLVDLAISSTVLRYQVISTGELLFDAADNAASFENVSVSMYQHLNESRQATVEHFIERIKNMMLLLTR